MQNVSWITWALLSALFAALTAILAKIGLERMDSVAATFIRSIVIIVVLAALVSFRGSFPDWSVLRSPACLFLLASGLATGASWLCYFRALQLGDAARVAPLDKFSVILVAVFGSVFLGETLTAVNWLGVALTGIGLLLVAYN